MTTELTTTAAAFALPEAEIAEAIAEALVAVGAGSFDAGLADRWHDGLRREARARNGDARKMQREGYVRYAARKSMRSPSQYAVSKPGRALDALHHHPRVIATLERATGRDLEPTRCSYLFYGPGDFMGLHTDASACFVTMLVPVAGRPPALTVFPGLRGASAEELARCARRGSGLAEGGRRVPFPPRGFIVLYGNELPHQRGRVPEGEQISVATLCFAPPG